LEIRIHPTPDALQWSRQFNRGRAAVSVFRPVGRWPDGCWIEHVGPLRLALKVDVQNGEWRWNPVGMRLWGLPLPAWAAPRVVATKGVEDKRYRFSVVVSHPLLGLMLSYGGVLEAQA
jgi:hypothetical protein